MEQEQYEHWVVPAGFLRSMEPLLSPMIRSSSSSLFLFLSLSLLLHVASFFGVLFRTLLPPSLSALPLVFRFASSSSLFFLLSSFSFSRASLLNTLPSTYPSLIPNTSLIRSFEVLLLLLLLLLSFCLCRCLSSSSAICFLFLSISSGVAFG